VRRVGFSVRFSVKLGLLWAVESDPPPTDRGVKRLKSLRKLAGKGESPKVMKITLTDPERI
jgi:hypothetical protein